MKFIILMCLFSQLCNGFETNLQSENIKKRHHSRFLFTSPKIFNSGKNETVCVTLFETNIPTKILIDLKMKNKHYVTNHMLHSDHECFEMVVPKLKNHIRDAQRAHLQIQLDLNGTVHTKHGQEQILILPKKHVVFIETDKTYYKPGDKVKIRILILTGELKAPENFKIKMIKVLNPSGITVTVWENLPTELGFVQLEHQLTQDTSMGKWKIEVNENSQIFEVTEYILPRYVVTLECPKIIYVASNYTKYTVCAKYLFGKKVHGSASLTINSDKKAIPSISDSKKLLHGCVTFKFPNADLLLQDQINSYIRAVATVTEQDSNRTEFQVRSNFVKNQPFELKFLNNNYFQPGLPYYGKLKVVNKLISLQGEIIAICYNVAVRKTWNIVEIRQCSNLTFGSDDVVNFIIQPLKEEVVQIRLYAKSLNQTVQQNLTSTTHFQDITAYLTLNRWYSPTNSHIQVDKINKAHPKCKSAQQFNVYYTTNKLKDNQNVIFYYMIKSRNRIYKMRTVTHKIQKQNIINFKDLQNGIGTNHNYTKTESYMNKYILKFKLDPKIISKYQLIVYYVLPNGETVAANVDVNIENCLLNKIETIWSQKQYYPGERASITIKTSANSLCAISTVDKSVALLSSKKHLSIPLLLNSFLSEAIPRRSNKLNCIPQSSSFTEVTTNVPELDLRKRRRRSNRINSFNQYDSYEAFNNFGVLTISNLKLINKPCSKDENDAAPYKAESLNLHAHSVLNPNYYDIQVDDRKTAIRSFFPETWLWELVPINTNHTTIFRDLPHSVTNWVTNTICLSPTLGVGISDEVEITAFQPFFLDVLTPHSIKRGEVLHLQVILFNYLNYSLPIRITLGGSDGFELPILMDEQSAIHCISALQSKSVEFRVVGRKLGKFSLNVLAEIESSYPSVCGPEFIFNKRDVVVKDVLILPEGYTIDDTQSTFICSDDSENENNVTWNLELPQNVIPNSAKANLIINADLLGPTIHNLEKLLLIPTGCGEQIMATLVPNLYILEYLKSTKKLTPGLQQRARRNLKIGYQRILDYVHDDGSFSAFGYHDQSGSMFLTAFVVNALQQAKTYIYVDQNVINKAVNWIFNHQLENGCFATVSHVFHSMGGTNIENSTAALTSYVLISLLEVGIEVAEKIRTNAKYCIRGHYSPDKYTLAISTYALFLVGWESEANRSLNRLIEVATTEGNLMWWSNPGSVAVNIEMTSYVLMSLLHQNSSANLVNANSVIRWLATQSGPNGGFVSTQDTVVALNAISKYAKLMRTKDADLHVNITIDKQEYEITINPKDRLKAKQQSIQNLPSELNVVVEGEGCVFVQAHVQYNVNSITSSEAFKLAVAVDSVSDLDQCSVAMVSPCIAYTGPGMHSNMAVLEITMPSGYEPDRSSLYKLTEDANSKVKKFEESENRVVLYFTELTNEPICLQFNINENVQVDTRLDAYVKLYDYYNPELIVSTTYKVNVCQLKTGTPIPQLPANETNRSFRHNYFQNKNGTILGNSNSLTTQHKFL